MSGASGLRPGGLAARGGRVSRAVAGCLAGHGRGSGVLRRGVVSHAPFVTRLELKGPDGGDLSDEKRCVRWSQP